MKNKSRKIIIEKIKFFRGTTFRFCFSRKDTNGNVILTKPEKMWFAIKTNDKIIKKSLEDGTITFDEQGYYHIIINPEDTKALPCDDYVCGVLIRNGNDVEIIYSGTASIKKEPISEEEMT